ncbi:MAG: hypothetical protein K2Q27_02005 [Novosphingobium sp.]|nr:hypothetical protein [Novosphingobium sp.]
MKLSTRFGLVGLGGLALLSAVQWARQQHLQHGAALTYLIGVGPNFAAAIAITFVLLAAWLDMRPVADAAAVGRRFRISAAVSALGLIGWECVQMTSHALVFDWHDVLATLAGIAVSVVQFRIVRGTTPNPLL